MPRRQPQAALGDSFRPRIPEKAFQERVLNLARACGWQVWHFHTSMRRVRDQRDPSGYRMVGDTDAKGWPDLVLAMHGRAFARELKAEGGTVSPEQRETLDLLRSAGWDVGVWWERDWPLIEEWLNADRLERTKGRAGYAPPGRNQGWKSTELRPDGPPSS